MNEELLQAAITAITQEIENEPQNANLYKERGRLRMMTGDQTGAMEDLRQAIAIDPTLVGNLKDGTFQGNIGSCH